MVVAVASGRSARDDEGGIVAMLPEDSGGIRESETIAIKSIVRWLGCDWAKSPGPKLRCYKSACRRQRRSLGDNCQDYSGNNGAVCVARSAVCIKMSLVLELRPANPRLN